jgi:hypothetical protein
MENYALYRSRIPTVALVWFWRLWLLFWMRVLGLIYTGFASFHGTAYRLSGLVGIIALLVLEILPTSHRVN